MGDSWVLLAVHEKYFLLFTFYGKYILLITFLKKKKYETQRKLVKVCFLLIVSSGINGNDQYKDSCTIDKSS